MDIPILSYDQLPLTAAVEFRNAVIEPGKLTCKDGTKLSVKAVRIQTAGSMIGSIFRVLIECVPEDGQSAPKPD